MKRCRFFLPVGEGAPSGARPGPHGGRERERERRGEKKEHVPFWITSGSFEALVPSLGILVGALDDQFFHRYQLSSCIYQ